MKLKKRVTEIILIYSMDFVNVKNSSFKVLKVVKYIKKQ